MRKSLAVNGLPRPSWQPRRGPANANGMYPSDII